MFKQWRTPRKFCVRFRCRKVRSAQPDITTSMSKSSSPTWRWLESRQPDLFYFGLPRRFPWPSDVPTAAASNPAGFPMNHLLRALQLMQATPGFVTPAVWLKAENYLQQMDGIAMALEDGDLDRTAELLEQANATFPDTPYYHFNMGFLLREQRAPARAAHHYREAVRLYPDFADGWGHLGAVLRQTGDDAGAKAALWRAFRLNPQNKEVAESLVDLQELFPVRYRSPGGEIEERLAPRAEFEKNIRLSVAQGGQPRVMRHLAADLVLKQEAALAHHVLQKLLENSPDDVWGQRLLCETLRLTGRREECLAQHAAFALAHPDDISARYYRALAEGQFVDSALRRTGLLEALAPNPNFALAILALFEIGPDYRDQKDPAAHRACAAWAQQHGSWTGLLYASIQAGMLKLDSEALDLAMQAYALQPDDRQVLVNYTARLSNSDEPEKLAAALQPRLLTPHGDFELRFLYAGALHKMGLHAEAIATLEKAAAEHPAPEEREWHEHCRERLGTYIGEIAECDVTLELLANTLRRPVMMRTEETKGEFVLQPGIALPIKKTVELTAGDDPDSITVELQQGQWRADKEPLKLGFLHVAGVDMDAGACLLHLRVSTGGQLTAGATQGAQNLKVTWSLYGLPEA